MCVMSLGAELGVTRTNVEWHSKLRGTPSCVVIYRHCASGGRTKSNTIFLLKPSSQSKAHERPTWKNKNGRCYSERRLGQGAKLGSSSVSSSNVSVSVSVRRQLQNVWPQGKAWLRCGKYLTKTHRLGWSYSFVEPPILWNFRPTVSCSTNHCFSY